MRAYHWSRFTLVALFSTLAGCGSGTDSGGSPDEGGTSTGLDSSVDAPSIPGVDAGLDAVTTPGLDSGFDTSTTPGLDTGTTPETDSAADTSTTTETDSAADTSTTTETDSAADTSTTTGLDSGADAKADATTAVDAAADAKADATSAVDAAADAKADSSAAEAGTTTGICNFASGLNVAWVNFANDVPNPDIATFTTIFKNAKAAGGRVIRWWFHTNGTVTPGYQSNGMAQDLPQSHIDGVKAILAAAAAQGVAVNISLWSFDMLQGSSETISSTTTTNNMNLLQVAANRQAYITNYLTPLVKALKGTPGLYSYEIFNEPEGMNATGWATYRTTEAYIQTCVNQFAAAIHAADPDTPVTNGSQVFQYCSTVNGNTNYYSDANLRAAGGMQTGTLDFYEVHYYSSNGTANSCFLHPASYWKLDKKLVMGEFYAATTDGIAQDDTYTYLYNNGYNGAWAWSYESDMPWPSMQVPMQDLYNAETSVVGSCP